MEVSFWIAQVFGLIAMGANVVAMQINNKRKILFFYTVANFSYVINFILLGAFTGAIICFLQGIETIINGVLDIKNIKIPKWLILIYILLAFVMGIYTYSRILDVLAVIGGILYVLTVSTSKEPQIRKLTFISTIVWIIYDLGVKSYVVGISDLLILISTTIGIYRFDIKNGNFNKTKSSRE